MSWSALCAAGGTPELAAMLKEREGELQPDDPQNIQMTSGKLVGLLGCCCHLREEGGGWVGLVGTVGAAPSCFCELQLPMLYQSLLAPHCVMLVGGRRM